jgi:hypothetical protein
MNSISQNENDISEFYIGDNYEASVIIIVTGYQYISSAAAFIGYTFRHSWWRNYVFGEFPLCCCTDAFS